MQRFKIVVSKTERKNSAKKNNRPQYNPGGLQNFHAQNPPQEIQNENFRVSTGRQHRPSSTSYNLDLFILKTFQNFHGRKTIPGDQADVSDTDGKPELRQQRITATTDYSDSGIALSKNFFRLSKKFSVSFEQTYVLRDGQMQVTPIATGELPDASYTFYNTSKGTLETVEGTPQKTGESFLYCVV